MAQIYGGVAKVDVAFSLPDLANALKQIQTQYDSIAAQNLQVLITTINKPRHYNDLYYDWCSLGNGRLV